MATTVNTSMLQFRKLAKYSITARGEFFLVRNQSKRDVKIAELTQNGVEVDGQNYPVLGFDFPSKISKNVLKKEDVVGVQVKAY